MHNFITIGTSFAFSLFVACSHSQTALPPMATESPMSEASVREQDAPKSDGSLILRKNDPKAVEILRESCPGGYDALEDFSNPPSTEIGISHKFSGKTGPYVRYRCKGI